MPHTPLQWFSFAFFVVGAFGGIYALARDIIADLKQRVERRGNRRDAP